MWKCLVQCVIIECHLLHFHAEVNDFSKITNINAQICYNLRKVEAKSVKLHSLSFYVPEVTPPPLEVCLPTCTSYPHVSSKISH